MFFLFLFCLEVIFFIIASLFLAFSSFVALNVGLMFLTVFSYFILLFYFQAKKPMQMKDLRQSFIGFCRQMVAIPKGESEHHLSVAHALLRLVGNMQDMEYSYFSLNNRFLQRLSYFLHHKDVFLMKEGFLIAALEEHIEQIHYTPTDLEVHASLSNTYITLAKLYQEEASHARGKKYGLKCNICSVRSVEELKILKSFAPNDPWVHAQLAQVYQSLDQKEEEAQEYETILNLSPNDLEVWYRLGRLYFQLNKAAEGLKIYDKLKKRSYKKADDLLRFYEGTKIEEITEDPLDHLPQ
ncbi:MAG: hypothetical protein JW769_04410 [Parachlamydiales bacterium]|nr:hypothetical protein [Parachlamydiales bacterium]